MKIYTTHTTSRLTYILDLLLKDMLGLDYTITNDINEFNAYKGPAINYSGIQLNNAFQIVPCNLLFETYILDREIPPPGNWENMPVFFETPGREIPFDFFAASFFLISRYEEHLPFTADKHNRFPSSISYARKHNFHQLPLINMWIQKFREILEKHFPSIKTFPPAFQYLSTIDIDHAWAYLHRPLVRTSLSLLKSLLFRDIKGFQFKLDVLKGKVSDPFDNYAEWDILHKGITDKVILFFLVSSLSRYDMTICPRNKSWQKLIRELSDNYICGIHPSYRSYKTADAVVKQKTFLESIVGKTILRSRQHFVKLRFPDTYRSLIRAGIKEDYSMGFHDTTGFRAGIASPFKFFDLLKNEVTDLMIYPFAVMERTLKDYMGLDSRQAMMETEEMIARVKSCGGLFISIWHNSSLCDYGEWEGWKKNYIRMLELCKRAGK